MKRRFFPALALLLALCTLLCSCDIFNFGTPPNEPPIQLENIPEYDGSKLYVVINGNEPFFTDEEKKTVKSYESYSALDSLGRCGTAIACIGKDIMPNEEREPLYIEPSGWVQAKYDGVYLYNRCHLIGFQLTGENNNEKNLITGTDEMNKLAMLPFENMVDDYIEETGNHVMYRVTPIYKSQYDLVASGVLMEGWSVEDEGESICFNIYCYNAQPGVIINYLDGTSRAEGSLDAGGDDTTESSDTYILNTSSKKIHKPTCSGVGGMLEENKEEFSGDIQEKINEGYKACGICKPLE